MFEEKGRRNSTISDGICAKLVEDFGKIQRGRWEEIAWQDDEVAIDSVSDVSQKRAGTNTELLRLVISLDVYLQGE